MRKIGIELPQIKIAEFCKKWQISEFSLFGSVLGDNFGPDSDIDVLVSFAPDAHPTLFDMVRMRDELKEMDERSARRVLKAGCQFGPLRSIS